MAILSTAYHVEIANQAVQAFTSGTPKYIFVSRPNPWTDVNGSADDTIVPDADVSVYQTEGVIYSELVFGKLITPEDVINMIPRYNWIANTIYARYWNTDANLYSENFFVVTDDLNVYKCIDNSYGNPSTVKPTLTIQDGNFPLSDGYVWKYMYTIPSDLNSQFSTTNYVPIVANDSVVANAIPGTVDVIDLTSLGNNYSAFYSGFLQNAINSYVVVLDSNASPYSNFYVGSSMYLKAGYGAGQIRQIVDYDGLNKLVRLNSPFNSYATFSLSNVSGNFNIGDTLTQTIDNLAIYYNVGIFQSGDTILQSDSGASGQIISSNSTYLNVVRTTSNLFNISNPIFDTSQAGISEPGTVTVQSFPILTLLSNSHAFDINETIYQSNGSANIGVGIIFASQTNPVISVNFNSNLSVNSSLSFININNNPFSNGMQVVYSVTSGNTVVFGLANNATYYVVWANSTALSLSNTYNGSNISLSTYITETFNSNTGISPGNFISIINNTFVNGELITYTVSPGNTIPFGLSNGYNYYAVYANSTGLCLSQSFNGPNVNIIPGNVSQTGHNLTFNIPPEIGDSLTYTPIELLTSQISGFFSNAYQIKGVTSGSNAYIANVSSNNYGLNYVFSTNTAQTAFISDYAVGNYIRIGSNPGVNIRRILTVTPSYIILDSPIAQTAIANVHFLIPNAAEVASYTILNSNGIVSNTNLNSVQINFSNASLMYQSFIPGERIDMVNANNIFQGTYGTVSFCNTTTVIISEVVGGGFLQGFYLDGESSSLTAYINYIVNYPTITVSNPIGNFVIGQQIYSKSTSNLSVINGQANVISWYTVPGQLTEYVISPTVSIEGDGSGALAYSIVNTSLVASYSLSDIIVINNGTGYTYANVVISSNQLFGSGATALASISPILGHGADPLIELGASYVGISVAISNSTLEEYYFPTFGNYRVVGILDDPLFDNLYVNVANFNRIKLSLSSVSNAFSVGEIAYQPNTLSGGLVVYSNSSYMELEDIVSSADNFAANGIFVSGLITGSNSSLIITGGDSDFSNLFSNAVSANDNIVGMSSGSIANVVGANISYFNISSTDEVIIENSIANAVLVSITNTTILQVTNVSGLFSTNSFVYDPINNAYATVSSLAVDNNNVDVSSTFGYRFNQTLRFPMTANNGNFQIFETVTQPQSNSIGYIIGGSVYIPPSTNASIGNDIDINYSINSGSFSVGDIINNTGNAGVGIVIWSNSTYLRVTSVSGSFSNGNMINNTIGSSGTVANVYPVLILNDVSGDFSTGVLSGNIVGSTSGSTGRCDNSNVIDYPDLVRNTGTVLYLENLAPFTLSNISQESISLILSF